MQESKDDVQPPRESFLEERPAQGLDYLKRVYAWASKNTSEARELEDFTYYWPATVTKLLKVLELSEGSIIALVGLSGVGKSSAQVQVAKALNKMLCAGSTKRESQNDETEIKDPEREKEKEGQEKEGRDSKCNVARKAPRAVHFKWPGYFEQNHEKILEFLKQQNLLPSAGDLVPMIADRLQRIKDPYSVRRRLATVFGEEYRRDHLPSTRKTNFTYQDLVNLIALGMELEPDVDPLVLASKLLGPSDYKSVQRELAISLLARCHTIMIDLRDYGTKDSRAMNTDLTEIQKLWQLINDHLLVIKAKGGVEARSPNLVFVLQKELAVSADARVANYFLGKAARMFELSPLSPWQMVEAYKEQFGDTHPFDQGALELLAIYSRGVFRRYLRYISICLEFLFSLNGKFEQEEAVVAAKEEGGEAHLGKWGLTRNDVTKIIPPAELMQDWEVELRQLFPHGQTWKVASKILSQLSNGPEIQGELRMKIIIPNALKWNDFIGESELSRILGKLEEYGYVKRRSTEKGKLVAMNV